MKYYYIVLIVFCYKYMSMVYYYTVITGGATYMVISRSDGATVSEIVQSGNESTTCGKE